MPEGNELSVILCINTIPMQQSHVFVSYGCFSIDISNVVLHVIKVLCSFEYRNCFVPQLHPSAERDEYDGPRTL